MSEKAGDQVWLDRGTPDCEGEPRWEDRDGKRRFSCPMCSLDWYIVLADAARGE